MNPVQRMPASRRRSQAWAGLLYGGKLTGTGSMVQHPQFEEAS